MLKFVFAFLLLATVANAGGTPGTLVSPSGRVYTITAPDRDGDMLIIPHDSREDIGFYSPPRPRAARQYPDSKGNYPVSSSVTRYKASFKRK